MAEPPGVESDDEQWFARLQGRPVVANDADAVREGDALRRAILLERESHLAREQVDEGAEAGAERLLFALRREGLLTQKKQGWRKWVPLAAAAAFVAALAPVLLRGPLVDDGYDEPPGFRGGASSLVIKHPTPREQAEVLAKQVNKSGGSARIYRKGKVFVVDVDVPPERADTIREALRGQVALPEGAQIRIEINPP